MSGGAVAMGTGADDEVQGAAAASVVSMVVVAFGTEL